MVAGLVVGITVIIATGGAATPAVAAAAAEGIAASAAAATGAVTTGVAVAGATGTAAAAGAVTGAVAGTSLTSAAVGAVVGSSTAVGVSGVGGGAAAAATTGLLAGPVGWICLGATCKPKSDSNKLTFDCWKPVIHDNSTQPSKGMLLREILLDSRIKEVNISTSIDTTYPEIQLRNIWEEKFQIMYVRLPSGELAAHASPL